LWDIAKSAGLKKEDLSKLFDWVSDSWKHSAKGRAIISAPVLGDKDILKN